MFNNDWGLLYGFPAEIYYRVSLNFVSIIINFWWQGWQIYWPDQPGKTSFLRLFWFLIKIQWFKRKLKGFVNGWKINIHINLIRNGFFFFFWLYCHEKHTANHWAVGEDLITHLRVLRALLLLKVFFGYGERSIKNVFSIKLDGFFKKPF